MKRLFAVLFCTVMLLVSGCKSASLVNASVNEKGELMLYMSDGSSINAGLVKGADGADGVNGSDGRDGMDGEDGKDGQNGKNGKDGVSIVSAAVNASGELILSLSDDTTINAGVVRGADGRDGADGKDGRDGVSLSPAPDVPATVAEPVNEIPPEPLLKAAAVAGPGFTMDADDPTILTGYTGTDAHISIPDGLQTIGKDVFTGNTFLCSIDIPASVTTIDEGAFSGCTSLTSVTFSKNSTLNDIMPSAFEGCTKLGTIEFPPSLKEIGAYAFKDSALSDTLVFYGSITIGEHAFENTAIEKILLSSEANPKLTVLSHGFAGCTGLKSIEIPCRKFSLDLRESSFSGCGDLDVYLHSKPLAMKYAKSYSGKTLGLNGVLAFVFAGE